MQTLIENRRARAEYTIVETFEAGIVLSGPEVKMLRLKRGGLVGAHVRVMQDEAVLLNAQIPAYPYARQEEYDPKRTRKLLLHKHEILKLKQSQETKGSATIPLSIGISHGFMKVKVAIARGKKQYERREELKKRDLAREVERVTKKRMK
ncbi:MAG: SsrA-binding protein [Candidatus Pacebacteria bacterium RIFCSPHIGHO2_01_FULL_46_10]|nr:MAG: SsrA-binding protein [Candidatus Pacebacteria bacterium RIFCSPHIGHO2_01_FULL_46_10]